MRGTLQALSASFLLASGLLAAGEQTFVLGVENQDYLPVSNFRQGEYEGFARELFDAFARDRGYRFEYRPLPVPRLYASFFQGQLDFKFPDNSRWKEELRSGHGIVYSDAVMVSVDGVSVLPARRGAAADSIRVLGTMAGFTPWPWLERARAGKVALSENAGFSALVRQTLAGRIDGAYASVAVVNYQLDRVFGMPGALVFDPSLPHSRDTYHLSSIGHPEIVREFNAWLKNNRAAVEALKQRHGVEKGVRPE